MKLPTQTQEN